MEKAKEPTPLYKLVILIAVVVPFIATIYAIVQLWQQYVRPIDLVLMIVLYVISGMGITIGFHRLLTHKSFETIWPIKAFLLIAGSLAVEGPAISWASTHIKHHAHSDDEDDPHSPLQGLWHAHIGWMFLYDLDVTERYGGYLKKDRLIKFISDTFVVWVALGLVVPFLIAGWQGLLWGGLVRIFLTHHITWSVNSICHTFGGRMFQTTDQSRNNFVVGLLAFGEGWHNNHHMFPRAAFHGMRWWQIDTSAYVIRLLGALGLAWNIWQPTREMQARRLISADNPAAVSPAESEA